MLLKRKNPFNGKVNEMDLDITQEQLNRWMNGELIQNVFPFLNPDEREFIKTGITSDTWPKEV